MIKEFIVCFFCICPYSHVSESLLANTAMALPDLLIFPVAGNVGYETSYFPKQSFICTFFMTEISKCYAKGQRHETRSVYLNAIVIPYFSKCHMFLKP